MLASKVFFLLFFSSRIDNGKSAVFLHNYVFPELYAVK